MSTPGEHLDLALAELVNTLADMRRDVDGLQADVATLRSLLTEPPQDATDDEGGKDAPFPRPEPVPTTYSTELAQPTPITHGEAIEIDIGGPLTVRVYSNATTLTQTVYTGEGPAVFTLESAGIHTLIVDSDEGGTVRYFVNQAAAGGDQRVKIVRGTANGFVMETNHPKDLVVSGRHYQGQDSHQPDGGVGILIRNKPGGTVRIEDVGASDLSAGIIVQGLSRDQPIERLDLINTRIERTWKDYLDASNFWKDRPQGLFTANIKEIHAEGLEIFQSYKPGLNPVFDRWHNWYASGSDRQLLQFETHLKNSVLYGGSFSGLNISQITSADRVYIIGSPVNWNVDARIDTGWVPAVTGKVTNSYSINPSKTPVFGRNSDGEIATRPWGQHFTYPDSLIDGVTTLDGVDLDIDLIMAAPWGEAYLEVERQLRERGLLD